MGRATAGCASNMRISSRRPMCRGSPSSRSSPTCSPRFAAATPGSTSRPEISCRPIAGNPSEQRRRARVQQRLALHLAARPLRLHPGNRDAAGMEIRRHGRHPGRAAGWRRPRRSGAHRQHLPARGERISVADSVRAYTKGSAFAAFSDKQVGTLEGTSSPISPCCPRTFSRCRPKPSVRPGARHHGGRQDRLSRAVAGDVRPALRSGHSE